jgi:hypothetical protein
MSRVLSVKSDPNAGADTITDLDLSDFDSTSHGNSINHLKGFVDNFPLKIRSAQLNCKLSLLKLPDMCKSGDKMLPEVISNWLENFEKDWNTAKIMQILAKGNIPRPMLDNQITSFTQPLHIEELQKATLNLLQKFEKDFKVTKIMRLVAIDNPFHPMKDVQIARFTKTFRVEELDWEKYDLDIRTLMVSQEYSTQLRQQPPQDQRIPASDLRKLHLYSSGHSGVLYHWAGEDGLVKLPRVSTLLLRPTIIRSYWLTITSAARGSYHSDLSGRNADSC